MTEEAVLQWLLVAVGCHFAYHTAHWGATIRPLTWRAVFVTGMAIAFAWWIAHVSDMRGRSALIALVAFVLAIVIGATRGTGALRLSSGRGSDG
jgi:hypothetical protein